MAAVAAEIHRLNGNLNRLNNNLKIILKTEQVNAQILIKNLEPFFTATRVNALITKANTYIHDKRGQEIEGEGIPLPLPVPVPDPLPVPLRLLQLVDIKKKVNYLQNILINSIYADDIIPIITNLISNLTIGGATQAVKLARAATGVEAAAAQAAAAEAERAARAAAEAERAARAARAAKQATAAAGVGAGVGAAAEAAQAAAAAAQAAKYKEAITKIIEAFEYLINTQEPITLFKNAREYFTQIGEINIILDKYQYIIERGHHAEVLAATVAEMYKIRGAIETIARIAESSTTSLKPEDDPDYARAAADGAGGLGFSPGSGLGGMRYKDKKQRKAKKTKRAKESHKKNKTKKAKKSA